MNVPLLAPGYSDRHTVAVRRHTLQPSRTVSDSHKPRWSVYPSRWTGWSPIETRCLSFQYVRLRTEMTIIFVDMVWRASMDRSRNCRCGDGLGKFLPTFLGGQPAQIFESPFRRSENDFISECKYLPHIPSRDLPPQ